MALNEINEEQRLAAISAEAEVKRHEVLALADLAKERVRPSRLAKKAGNRALDAGLDGIDLAKSWARAHPFKAAGIGSAVAALIARKPLWKLIAGVAPALSMSSRRKTRHNHDEAAETPPPEGV